MENDLKWDLDREETFAEKLQLLLIWISIVVATKVSEVFVRVDVKEVVEAQRYQLMKVVEPWAQEKPEVLDPLSKLKTDLEDLVNYIVDNKDNKGILSFKQEIAELRRVLRKIEDVGFGYRLFNGTYLIAAKGFIAEYERVLNGGPVLRVMG